MKFNLNQFYEKLFFLLGALLYYCGVEAQNVQSIGGHSIWKSAGKFYELYPSDTIEIDTTKIIISFTREFEKNGVEKVQADGYNLKRKTPFGKYVYFLPKSESFTELISALASLAEIDNFKLNHIRMVRVMF